MNRKLILSIAGLIAIVLLGFKQSNAQEPWTENQLMSPSVLAAQLTNVKSGEIVIYNIGPSGTIKTAVDIGSTEDSENMVKLKKHLATLPVNTDVVIYCGCCPFDKCPNIRPAFELLNQMKFVNAKLLNMPKNLKADWIDKGYPMQN